MGNKRRGKYDPRKRLRRLFRGAYCEYDGNPERKVTVRDPYGRELSEIEAAAFADGFWQWSITITAIGTLGDARREVPEQFTVNQWTKAEELGDYMDARGEELIAELPAAWKPKAVIWKAVITG